jgi:hypothetical protein
METIRSTPIQTEFPVSNSAHEQDRASYYYYPLQIQVADNSVGHFSPELRKP